ncbi:MAG: glycosyltransferase [Actinobacteria bacterium]|uniref:Unannotated protein n=1 Tax=freshwater metagenome TaxID=449393 RepID=A0A6J7KPA9_9ZZZZ|nr:glycosyltransferase [Actinomycetota bacterium]MSW79204.1 glycosyltransferase [Actinomycetota bacterium]MSX56654.1 glycosyltransferase [Actinomycetota bacterium]MSZ84810.1 glycosyltransferase [Actinomycetota bacterium]MTB18855.1 glycosyltransferase [Actinomycetota bacterium]
MTPNHRHIPAGTPLGDLLRLVPEVESGADNASVFLSVAVRTQGTRATLADTLTCLAAQTCDDLEVLLYVDTTVDANEAAVRAMLASFDETFRSRVRVERLEAGNRVAPLNRAIESATGRYLAILDDDDLVFANWVEDFLASEAPGRMLRSRAVEQEVHLTTGGVSDLEPVSGFVSPYAERFDMLQHVGVNHSPIHTLAFPLQQLRQWGLRFDPTLPVLEDWDLLLRTAPWTGVIDTGHITALYRKWGHTEASIHKVPKSEWAAASDALLDRLDARPLLLPPGSARQIHQLVNTYEIAIGRAERAEARIEAIERSRVWRATKPVRAALQNPKLRGAVRPALRLVRRMARRSDRPQGNP